MVGNEVKGVFTGLEGKNYKILALQYRKGRMD